MPPVICFLLNNMNMLLYIYVYGYRFSSRIVIDVVYLYWLRFVVYCLNIDASAFCYLVVGLVLGCRLLQCISCSVI